MRPVPVVAAVEAEEAEAEAVLGAEEPERTPRYSLVEEGSEEG